MSLLLDTCASCGSISPTPDGVLVHSQGRCRPWKLAAAPPTTNLRPDGAGFLIRVRFPRGDKRPLAMGLGPIRGEPDGFVAPIRGALPRIRCSLPNGFRCRPVRAGLVLRAVHA